MNRDDRRKKLRELSGCSADRYVPAGEKLPVARPALDCVVDVTPLAEKFIAPAPCPTVTPTTLIPEPLILSNEELTLSCPNDTPKDGPLGDPVTIAAGTYTLSFYFVSISDITSNQLTFISTISEDERDELREDATSVARIIEITGLSTAQATELKDGVTAVQTAVNDLVYAIAYGNLICYWENAEQQVDCSEDALTNDDKSSLPDSQHTFINNPSVMAEGVVRSVVSQEDADTIALDQAEANLLCLFGNDERTRSCLDIGFAEDITDVDDVADTLDGQFRMGYATVDANIVFSTESKADANAAADIIAEGLLNCFYINDEVTVTCAGEGRVTGVDPGVDSPPFGDAVLGTPGQSVTVPVGMFTSIQDTEHATSLATEYALSLLECWVCNEEQTRECPALEYVNAAGDTVVQEAADISDPKIVVVPACTITSEISLEDANTRAIALGDSQLDCVYCNDLVPPQCIPDGYTTVPVNLDDYDNTWSTNATRGIAANTFCCRGTDASQNCYDIAVGVNATPIPVILGGIDCNYENEEIVGDCDTGAYVVGTTPPSSTGRVGTFSGVPAGVFSVPASAGGRAQANAVAVDFANASSICYWENEEVTVTCAPADCNLWGANAVSSATVDAGIVTSFESQEQANTLAQLLAESNLNCVYVNKCVSLQDPNPTFGNATTEQLQTAFAQAHAWRLTQGGCLTSSAFLTKVIELLTTAGVTGAGLSSAPTGYCAGESSQCKDIVEDVCPSGRCGPDGIAAGSVESTLSVEAATEIAKIMLLGAQMCLDQTGGDSGGGTGGGNGQDGQDGLPGNDGHQENCQGACYGFYS